jgi:hypothetical protein
MWRLWGMVGGIENPDWRLFGRPDVRRQMAPIVGQSREKYAEAADHIEQALSLLR